MAQKPIGMILAAGYGTRLLSLSQLRAKPLMELLGKPMILFNLEMLKRAGIDDVVINLHHHSWQFRKLLREFRSGPRVHLVYEDQILGTAGGIKNAMNRLGISGRDLLLVHGDILCDLELDIHQLADGFCTLICQSERHVDGYEGGIGIDRCGQLVELGKYYRTERPAQRRGFFTGIHYLSSKALSLLNDTHGLSLVADVYPTWLHQGKKLTGLFLPMMYEDLGAPMRLLATNLSLLERASDFRHRAFKKCISTNDDQDIFFSEDSYIDRRAKIVGPCLIGRGARIDKGTTVGPSAIIGGDCWIKDGSSVRNSVVMSNTVVEKDEDLDCAIALLGARVLVKSYRLKLDITQGRFSERGYGTEDQK